MRHDHPHSHAHGHSHGLVDRSIVRSREGVKAVALSLAILGVAAVAQLAIFLFTSSVALLADLIHNFGDALTAVPLGIAFFLRSFRGEKLAGLAVVLAIFISACVALYETIQRFLHPEDLTHLWVLAAAGVIGFAGNELAAQVRLRAGRRLSSPALIADGNHARTDGFVSLGVVASAIIVALGFPRGDPIIGLVITLVIFKITWDSWRLVSTTDPARWSTRPRPSRDGHGRRATVQESAPSRSSGRNRDPIAGVRSGTPEAWLIHARIQGAGARLARTYRFAALFACLPAMRAGGLCAGKLNRDPPQSIRSAVPFGRRAQNLMDGTKSELILGNALYPVAVGRIDDANPPLVCVVQYEPRRGHEHNRPLRGEPDERRRDPDSDDPASPRG